MVIAKRFDSGIRTHALKLTCTSFVTQEWLAQSRFEREWCHYIILITDTIFTTLILSFDHKNNASLS